MKIQDKSPLVKLNYEIEIINNSIKLKELCGQRPEENIAFTVL
jgi:hypothetical protein